jgi:hypothetical protein
VNVTRSSRNNPTVSFDSLESFDPFDWVSADREIFRTRAITYRTMTTSLQPPLSSISTTTMMVFRVGLLVVTGLRTVHAFALPSNKTPYYSTTTALQSSNKFNPFTNMLGDVASSIMGGGGSAGPNDPNLDATLASISNTSWDSVRSTLESLQTPEERNFRSSLQTGRGPPSPLHKIRLYDDSNSEEDIRVTFFRDSASWCPVCFN